MRITEKVLLEFMGELEKQLKINKIIAEDIHINLEYNDKYKRLGLSNGRSLFTSSYMTNSELYYSIRVCLQSLSDNKQSLLW